MCCVSCRFCLSIFTKYSSWYYSDRCYSEKVIFMFHTDIKYTWTLCCGVFGMCASPRVAGSWYQGTNNTLALAIALSLLIASSVCCQKLPRSSCLSFLRSATMRRSNDWPLVLLQWRQFGMERDMMGWGSNRFIMWHCNNLFVGCVYILLLLLFDDAIDNWHHGCLMSVG